MTATNDSTAGRSAGLALGTFRRFCRLATDVFYRECEVTGLEHLPAEGPLVLCANHVNALVDAAVVQATCPRPVHPLARSGLFRNPLLGTILRAIEAVPIHRRHGDASVKERNEDSFRQIYEHLAAGRAVLIFPEGQSHSDPSLRPLKTGAARLALGAEAAGGPRPAVVPVGLTFTRKGKFRGDVLVQYGRPVAISPIAGEPTESTVRRLTEAIGEELATVTLNADSWQDVAFLQEIQRFFELRAGTERNDAGLASRFRTLQQLIEVHRLLRLVYPNEVGLLTAKLERFGRLCARYGVRDYHLKLRYDAGVVARFVLRALGFALVVFPLAFWGWLNSAIPYHATRLISRRIAQGRDQYDTASIVYGTLLFALFWGGQSFAVYQVFGTWPAIAYALSLPATSAVALRLGKTRKWILENIRVFFLFLRKREIQRYLQIKREELEVDIARMTQLAREVTPESFL
jgi:1-acyl-sn-glycerol-3-phosphate acyltransferase